MTNKQLVRKYLKMMTHGKPGDLTKLITPNLLATQGPQRLAGAEAAEAYAAYYRQAFAGWTFEVERMIAEGAWVAVKGCSVGTIQIALRNAVPAGTKARVPWIAHYRIARGRIAEVHMLVDTTSLEARPNSVEVTLTPA
jgi:predicted ester cyclase